MKNKKISASDWERVWRAKRKQTGVVSFIKVWGIAIHKIGTVWG